MARVLVVEDNPVNLALLQYLLGACGHEVLVAADGFEGLRVLRESRPDIVLCDIELPRLDGIGFVKAARSEGLASTVPLLAVTSNAMVGDRARFIAAGFDDYIAKPIDPQRFTAWMEEHLRSGGKHADAPAAHGDSVDLPAHSPSGPLVLVVDNVVVNLELMRSCLEPTGYRVRTATSAGEGYAAALAETPQLIISDVGMPSGDGFDFISRVKQVPTLRDVPFIFISMTHWDELSHTKAIALGATRYLRRPLPPEELVAEVERALAQAQRGPS